jgi:hypothetical protein
MRVMRAYNGAKKVRRVLKAHASNGEIPCTVYESQMEMLMDSQLELELYKPEKPNKAGSDKAKSPNALLPAFEKRTEISDDVDKLENYLNEIIKEYDGDEYSEVKKKLGINGKSSQIPLDDLDELEKLKRFIDRQSFKKRVLGPGSWFSQESQKRNRTGT